MTCLSDNSDGILTKELKQGNDSNAEGKIQSAEMGEGKPQRLENAKRLEKIGKWDRWTEGNEGNEGNHE